MDEGWCEGTLNGKRGMFPDNFVQLREPQKVPPPADPAPQIRGEREGGGGERERGEREGGRGREGEGGRGRGE